MKAGQRPGRKTQAVSANCCFCRVSATGLPVAHAENLAQRSEAKRMLGGLLGKLNAEN